MTAVSSSLMLKGHLLLPLEIKGEYKGVFRSSSDAVCLVVLPIVQREARFGEICESLAFALADFVGLLQYIFSDFDWYAGDTIPVAYQDVARQDS